MKYSFSSNESQITLTMIPNSWDIPSFFLSERAVFLIVKILGWKRYKKDKSYFYLSNKR